ncbi:hypothetical protein AB0F07_05505 [Streptomyces fructofermentans]|uniref:hypothetical protein n=1 Tax=Streptomyces fructofermentans TaxID=152141 RepID=UPI0033CE7BAC
MRGIRPLRPMAALALFVAGSVAVTACGSGGAASGGAGQGQGGGRSERAERARLVSAAWKDSEAAKVWREGYYPLGDPVRLPEGAFRNEADKRAYLGRSFELRGTLPAPAGAKGAEGKVRWRAGGSLTVPVDSARASYERLDQGEGPGPALVVTGARFGSTSVLTSRGPATVPAWHFTLKGYDTPLTRVAVTGAEKDLEPPIEPLEMPTDDLAPLGGLVSVSKDGRRVTVRAEHGSCDDGPAVDVAETGDSVVLSGWVRGTSDGPCKSDLRIKKVTVELDAPVGERLLLDAFTGMPVS